MSSDLFFFSSSDDEDEVNSELAMFTEACQAAYEASKPKLQRTSGIVTELKALPDFKKSLIDESDCLASWVGNNCCSWDGVSCQYDATRVRSLTLNNLACLVQNPVAVLGDISNNSLTDVVSELHFAKHSKLGFLSMASNIINISDPIFVTPLSSSSLIWFPFTEHLNSSVKGVDQRYTSTLLYLVDLSSNNISGEIPSELVNLIELRNLNLSGNCLEGKIPDKIGHLKNLESLDLSKNQLSRNIPISMSNLNFLSHLNLSYNNLTGRIPGGNQLQTLDDPSIYAGNKFLCGQQILKSCSNNTGHESPKQRPNRISKNTDQGHNASSDIWFYAGMGPGLFVGLVGFCTILLFKKSWSYRYFLFIENCYIWLVSVVETIFQTRK
ncbi:LRR receptor-like serine/threonine-protein kinase FLS2 [Tanacetum coccineum]